MMLFSELNIVSISISFVVLAFIREANCNDFLKSLFTLNKPFFYGNRHQQTISVPGFDCHAYSSFRV